MTKSTGAWKLDDDRRARVDAARDDDAVDGRVDLRVPEVRRRLPELRGLRADGRLLALDGRHRGLVLGARRLVVALRRVEVALAREVLLEELLRCARP